MIRAIFDHQNVQYVNDFIKPEQWPSEKPKYEFGQLPVLDIDGLSLAQSFSILIYLSRKYNLLGKDAKEEYYITSLLNSMEDLSKHIAKIMRPSGQDEVNNVEQNKKALLETHAPFYFRVYEKRFIEHGGKYTVGNSFTLADVFVGVMLGGVLDKFPGMREVFEKEAPKLSAHAKNLIANDLKTFYEKSFLKDAPF
jgi:glutathione S-transferase